MNRKWRKLLERNHLLTRDSNTSSRLIHHATKTAGEKTPTVGNAHRYSGWNTSGFPCSAEGFQCPPRPAEITCRITFHKPVFAFRGRLIGGGPLDVFNANPVAARG